MGREAVILAGGLGTRLREVVEEIPKSMAPVNGRPFLEYVLDHLVESGFTRIILATRYKNEAITSYFGDHHGEASLVYSVETEPLGTGGAVLLASSLVTSDYFFVLNGDTLFSVDFGAMEDFYNKDRPALTVALKPMSDFDRYGSVSMEGDRIVSFNEKKFCNYGLINGGIYVVDKKWLRLNAVAEKFSFEKDILEKRTGYDLITGYISDAYFIDIGIPEDYFRASTDLKR